MCVASKRSTQLEGGDGANLWRKMAVVTIRCKVMVERSPPARGWVWLIDLVLFFAFYALLFSSCRNTHVESNECQSLLAMSLFSVSILKNNRSRSWATRPASILTKSSLGFTSELKLSAMTRLFGND